MRIESRSGKPLNEITLSLYSIKTNMSHQFIPFAPMFSGAIEFDKEAKAYIEFQDSREVDLMIDMLEEFKRRNNQYFGAWA